MPTLVVAEHEGNQIRAGSRSALSAAVEIAGDAEGPVEILLLGAELDTVAAHAAQFAPVVVADHPALRHPTGDRYARVIADVARARGTTTITSQVPHPPPTTRSPWDSTA